MLLLRGGGGTGGGGGVGQEVRPSPTSFNRGPAPTPSRGHGRHHAGPPQPRHGARRPPRRRARAPRLRRPPPPAAPRRRGPQAGGAPGRAPDQWPPGRGAERRGAGGARGGGAGRPRAAARAQAAGRLHGLGCQLPDTSIRVSRSASGFRVCSDTSKPVREPLQRGRWAQPASCDPCPVFAVCEGVCRVSGFLE